VANGAGTPRTKNRAELFHNKSHTKTPVPLGTGRSPAVPPSFPDSVGATQRRAITRPPSITVGLRPGLVVLERSAGGSGGIFGRCVRARSHRLGLAGRRVAAYSSPSQPVRIECRRGGVAGASGATAAPGL
jgi:hypothetical protein